MTFELLCMGLIAFIFGSVLVFFGYRLFLILIPIWGFFFGFGLGAQTVQYVLGDAFLGTVTGWVVGFFVALIFAGLSYLFYLAAVAILSGSLGYALTVGLLGAIGLEMGFLVWLIAIVVAVIFAVVVLRFNIQKYVIIIATAALGTGAIILTMLAMFGNLTLIQLVENPVKVAIDNSFLWLLFFLVVAGLGIVAQIQANRNWEIETYNRWAEMEGA
ncbi:MAG: DUF4203 domain-containing protein [Anaerolineae bacterium]|nr:DUF4203 domain-containing protein [Anaerolineae bacterium]MCO5191564.1 DUF4203 domain-containing protein [Anaerolineae bacterium]MCO5196102.1 DUF4203 domain-containing protein [Anaerolineae bacterium]MCO5199131.1 DUF4203 domain-containing protein [Anaerolineae bacterium]MCO5204693.1 DUF4203 domain-containing protein [Anaerolineae bacterium]